MLPSELLVGLSRPRTPQEQDEVSIRMLIDGMTPNKIRYACKISYDPDITRRMARDAASCGFSRLRSL